MQDGPIDAAVASQGHLLIQGGKEMLSSHRIEKNCREL